jgi:hypothetical protein
MCVIIIIAIITTTIIIKFRVIKLTSCSFQSLKPLIRSHHTTGAHKVPAHYALITQQVRTRFLHIMHSSHNRCAQGPAHYALITQQVRTRFLHIMHSSHTHNRCQDSCILCTHTGAHKVPAHYALRRRNIVQA